MTCFNCIELNILILNVLKNKIIIIIIMNTSGLVEQAPVPVVPVPVVPVPVAPVPVPMQDQQQQMKLTDVEVKDEFVALNLLVSFISLAQKRGTYTLDESAKIWECIKKFQR
jgi:hypothetical protein